MSDIPPRLQALALAWPPHVLRQEDVAANGAEMFATTHGGFERLPGAPLETRGPYRFVRHPNYIVASLEILVLPLVFGQVWIALVWSVANALLVAWRIRVEDGALQDRRD